ncbi:MAG: hypothetical protein E7223_02295 [Clostridiales bacterium]|nr:hypothetical protein [Clostridiales bacterium]
MTEVAYNEETLRTAEGGRAARTKNKKNQNKKKFFNRTYFIYLAVLVAVVAIALVVLWNVLADYESGVPTNIMTRIAENIEAGTAEKIYKEWDTIETVEWETADGNAAYLNKNFAGKEITFEPKRGEYLSKAPVYALKADGEEFAKVSMTQANEESEFGFTRWDVTALSADHELKIQVLGGITPTVAGQPLNEKWRTETGTAVKELESIPDELYSNPTYDVYTISAMLQMPEIAGVDSEGNGAVVLRDDKTGAVTLGPGFDTELEAAIAKRTDEITEQYSLWMTDNLPWSGFNKYLLKGTPKYEQLRTLEVNWYTLHDSLHTENKKTYEFFQYSDDCLRINVYYELCVYRGSQETRYKTDLTLYYVLDKGVWKVADLITN